MDQVRTLKVIWIFLLASSAWSETTSRMNRDLLDDYIQAIYPCYDSPRGFLGCLELINALQENVTSPPHPPTSQNDTQRERSKRLREIESTWNPTQIPVDFKAQVDRLLNGIKNPAPAIEEGLNRLIHVHDLHGGITLVPRHPSHDSIGGIGVVLDNDGPSVIVHLLYDNSPAAKSGLQVGDEILKVNNQSTVNLDAHAVSVQFMGKIGTTVSMEIQRPSGTRQVLSFVRRRIDSPSIVSRIIKHLGKSFLHIAISSLESNGTCDYLMSEINSHQDVQGIVLDLRGNGGGLEAQGLCVATLFLGKQLIYEKRLVELSGVVASQGQLFFGEHEAITRLPLVVLIDPDAASAAELVAGSIQDHQRGWIVGIRSFGKGTIQNQIQIGSELIKSETVAEYLMPNGRGIQAIGVEPDFEVYRSLKPTPSKSIREEDFQPFALPPFHPSSLNERTPQIDSIKQDCLQSRHRADDLYQEDVRHDSPTDHQLYTAEEILNCSAEMI